MPLKILLSSILRKYFPDYDPLKGIDFVVDGKLTVAELCRQMKIPADKIKIVMINGKSEEFNYVIRGDERVGLFPPIGGG